MSQHDQSWQASASLGPWHKGERILQQRLGVAERWTAKAAESSATLCPISIGCFGAQLPFLLLGQWMKLGLPGRLCLKAGGLCHSPIPRRCGLLRSLPLLIRWDTPANGSPVGILGIELHTRRRNRVNGIVTEMDQQGFSLTVEHSFGNCPQYIQTRQVCAPCHRPLHAIRR